MKRGEYINEYARILLRYVTIIKYTLIGRHFEINLKWLTYDAA